MDIIGGGLVSRRSGCGTSFPSRCREMVFLGKLEHRVCSDCDVVG